MNTVMTTEMIISLYIPTAKFFPEGKGARVKYSVVVEEDLSYTVSFQGTAVNLGKCAVMSLTCDGASTNRRLWKLHTEGGETIHKVNNIFAKEAERPLFFISDPPHLLKTVQNCWWNSKRKLWVNHCGVLDDGICTCTCHSATSIQTTLFQFSV